MPAPAYLAAINPPSLVFAAVLAFINARALMRYELSQAWSRKPAWRKRLAFLPVALIVFVTAYLSVAVTLPMTSALLSGQATEVRVVAGKQSFGPRNICWAAVNLAYPHLIFSTLCGVSAEVRRTIGMASPPWARGFSFP